MYCDFYQLRERPFNVTADPKFLYLNARYREALASLQYGITQRKGFVTLIGEAGTGKTTLLKKLLDELDSTTRTVFIFNTNVTFDEILEYIFHEFDLPLHNGKRLYMLQRLNAFLLDELQHGRNVALLIDEAQDLEQSALEDLRLLSNLETAKEKILQIVLSGQPELGQKLGSPGLRQLRQRVAINCRLLPLAREEITEYLESRLTAAGAADPKLFTRDAEDRIYEISMGIPRLVNVVCDNSLVIGYALGKRRIGAEVVTEAAADLLTMESVEEPRGGSESAAPVAAAAHPHSRRWSQVGVVAVVLVAIVVGLLSVGRSLLRREPTTVSGAPMARPPLDVIRPGRLDAPAPARVPNGPRDDEGVTRPMGAAPEGVRDEAAAVDRNVAEPDVARALEPRPAARLGQATDSPAEAVEPGAPSVVPPAPAAVVRPDAWQEAPDSRAGAPDAVEPRAPAASAGNKAKVDEAAPPAAGRAPDVAVAVLEPPPAAVQPPPAAAPPASEGDGAAVAAPPRASDAGVSLAVQYYEPVTVSAGQSISALAVRKYGQASHTILDMVKLANPALRDVDVVSVGQTLRLPELDEGMVVLRQDDGRYGLLLLSSPAWQRVKGLEAVLRQRGFQAQVKQTDFGPGRPVYRLQVGGLSNRETALTTGKKLQLLFREDEQVAALAR